jgi:hypothetical protein
MQTPSKSNRSRLLAAFLLAPLVALAACGGDDDDAADSGAESALSTPDREPTEVTGDDAPAASAAADAEPDEPAGSGATADREQWIAVGADYLDGGDREFDECLSAGVIDGLGYENLSASGTTPEEFWSTSDITEFDIDVGDMDGVAENLVECGDLVDYFAEVAGGTEEQTACMREFFDDEDVAAVIVTSMLGAEPTDELLTKQTEMRACAEAASGD